MTCTVNFKRAGTNHSIPPLVIDARDALGIGMAISEHVASYTGPSEYSIGVDDDMSGGHIITASQEIATFEITNSDQTRVMRRKMQP